LGDVSSSNAEIRASGGTVNTSDELAAEASPDGQVSILDSIIPGVSPSVLDKLASNLCPALTNTWLAVGTGVVNIFATIFTGGEADADETAVAEAAQSTLGRVADTITTKLFTNGAGQFAGKAGDLVTDAGVSTAEIAGATLLAKVIVIEHSNVLYDGLSENTDFTNEADAGGNLTANELERQQMYGRPLTNTEVAQSNINSQSEIAAKTRSQSFYQRYFAVSNVNSLLNKLGTTILADVNHSFFSSVLSHLGKIFSPSSLFSDIFSPLTAKAALAQSTTDNSDYGNVQFGWSNDEVNLINSNPSYGPLENQLILTNSGEESAIAAKYGSCFSGNTTIGDLVSANAPDGENYLVRDDSGNVETNQGLCSPANLSYASPDALSFDASPQSPQQHDMVFRWRLAMSYGNTLDQLTAEEGGGS
jgi:hypothetical protein